MGRKSQIQPFKVIDNQSMSQAQIVGRPTHVKQTDVVQYVIDWNSGEATNGEILVEASLDGERWFPLEFGATISCDGASGNHQVVIQQVSFSDLRATFNQTNVASVGNITIELFASTKGA